MQGDSQRTTGVNMTNEMKLAVEIWNAVRFQHVHENDKYFPYFVELVISYHNEFRDKFPREKCGCFTADENNPDGWYDGMLCPRCGYVRGMDGKGP